MVDVSAKPVTARRAVAEAFVALNLAHMPVKGRVAQALISLKNQFGTNPEGHIDVELTRQDLASYAGATYETVFRVVNELIQEKLINTNGKKISIINYDKLFLLTQDDEL